MRSSTEILHSIQVTQCAYTSVCNEQNKYVQSQGAVMVELHNTDGIKLKWKLN